MRKEVPRDLPANRSRAAVKPGSSGKGVKRVAPVTAAGKAVAKKKKPSKQPEGEPIKQTSSQSQSSDSKAKKKLLKPKVVLTKLSPGSVSQLAKGKLGKDIKKEPCPKPVKPKPKKDIVSKGTKKSIKIENETRRATSAKIVRAVKDVKKARSVVASKMAKNAPKRLSNSATVRKLSGGINVVKKRVNKMSGKKPCVVSVKISNAHSTVTLSVKQNKQIAKKDMAKCIKSGGGKNNDRSTISIVKKGIASRRKSTSKECTSQESSPSQSPTRDTSPVRSKEGKSSKGKKVENVKSQKKLTKQSSIESKKGCDEKFKEKLGEDQNLEGEKSLNGKTEVIINDTFKIKTENVGEHQNMEIEFTNESSREQTEKDAKSNSDVMGSDCNDNEDRARTDYPLIETKVKSPLNEYGNLKSIDSTASDEIPLQILKAKQKSLRQDKYVDSTTPECVNIDNIKQENDCKEDVPLCQLDLSDKGTKPNIDKSKTKGESDKQSKLPKRPRMSKTALQKFDEESVAKLKISAKTKEKLKDLALKHKEAKLATSSKLRKKTVVFPMEKDDSDRSEDSDQSRKRKLHKFWNGPKRHRVASLNAIAKVHCLYENETRSALNDVISSAADLQRAIQESKREAKKLEAKEKKPIVKKPANREKKSPEPSSTRTLRTNPGVRSVGRNFDILNVISSTSLSSSSSSEESSDSGEDKKQLVLPPSVKQKQLQIKEESDRTSDDEVSKAKLLSLEDSEDGLKKVKKRRRKRNELTMDLKDMVVRKRMASLNASAIMTASYSTEKKSEKRIKEEEIKKEKKERKKKKKQSVSSPEAEDSSGDEDLIVRTTNNKQKVAVIVNQDTDVTITGVYVNSTTRSTHHEGYCSIAGMQYRISSTSHTQTEATAVATETVLHSEHPPCLQDAVPPQTVATTALPTPCKSYTPLSALSSMQPPGHHPGCQPPRGPPLSPLQRRHGCTSAFSAPPNYPLPPPPQQPPPPHPDAHGNYRWEVDMPCCSVQPSRICYYQPAGPLISTHHHHHHTSSSSVTSKLPPPPTPSSLPTPTPPPSSAPHPTSESSDSEVVITNSSENPPPVTYRYPPQQPYNYGYQYYPSPPASSHQYPGQQSHYHPQDLCYPPSSGYPPGYFPKGHYPPPPAGSFPRRYGHHQYYNPQEFYPNPPPNPNTNPPPSSNNQQMMVSAPPGGSGPNSSSYPPSESSYPTPSPVVDAYSLPPPQSYYPGYSAGPPPHCYSTHSPSRGLYLDAAYQGCPCPMQSCPKNVHTGPLTGASKGSLKNHESTLPLVALSLPLEPAGALGPPSPARGSAGMPPPPSPALATARNPPQSPPMKPNLEQTGLLTISKMVTDAVMLTEQVDTNIAELIPKTEQIKLEVEDIVKIEATEEVKCNRKRRKSLKGSTEIKRQAFEATSEAEINQPSILQERLITPKEEPDRIATPELERSVEKHVPLSDNGATVPVVEGTLNGLNPKNQPNKRKSISSDCEPAAKIVKCVKGSKVLKNKCVKRNKPAEENIAPDAEPVNLAASKVVCRRNSKPVERRKSSCSPHITPAPTEEESVQEEESDSGKKKKGCRTKKAQEKTKADHLLRSHGKAELTVSPFKERRLSKSGSTKSDCSPVRGAATKKPPPAPPVELDPSAESQVCLPGLRRSLIPKWSNGWSWEGSPYKAKVFLNNDDGAMLRTCYPAMRHEQGDIICPRDCILLKSGPRKIDLPFVAKVSAMWENPEDGEMMVSLLWYYRPEHTEQGRRTEDIPDEIFASRHKDTNSVACIEDKCFVLTFNEYCRYRKTVRRLEEGLTPGGRVVPLPDGGSDPRLPRQPPGRVAPDLVFFCRRVYDFRQKRILKNPC